MTPSPYIIRAAPEAQPLIQRFYLQFLFEMQQLQGYAHRQSMPSLERYWQDSGYAPFLLAAAGQVVGFALVSPCSRIHTTYDGRSCEALFVLRPHRRRRIGQVAAQALFSSYPGRWEVAAEGANTPGSTFWRATVDRYTGGRYDETWFQSETWRGPIQSFMSPPGAGNNKRPHSQVI